MQPQYAGGMDPILALGVLGLCLCALGMAAIAITVVLDSGFRQSVPEVSLTDESVWPMSAEQYSRKYGVSRFRRRQ